MRTLKKGDKITIIDPLEAGAVPDVAVTKATAEKAGWSVAYDAGKNTYTFTATYEGKRLETPVITWNQSMTRASMTTLIKC